MTDVQYIAVYFPEMQSLEFIICSCPQVLCPRCEVEAGSPKRKSKKAKDITQHSKKKMVKLDCLSDVEKALSETKDSASAVSTPTLAISQLNIHFLF